MAFVIALWLCFAVASARQRLDEAENNAGMHYIIILYEHPYYIIIITSDKGGGICFARICLSVCLSVC